eukprot:TRINITY_DN7006_c0_g1_i1.p1 TRINITY_DN7006_c0_g1~~TRINITY_DN7006_c0_g1_i1.p1  ORF type:complete len:1779 (+),score=242.57 TRINITY_DN7006_c0_g1_i1:617-5338(+)
MDDEWEEPEYVSDDDDADENSQCSEDFFGELNTSDASLGVVESKQAVKTPPDPWDVYKLQLSKQLVRLSAAWAAIYKPTDLVTRHTEAAVAQMREKCVSCLSEIHSAGGEAACRIRADFDLLVRSLKATEAQVSKLREHADEMARLVALHSSEEVSLASGKCTCQSRNSDRSKRERSKDWNVAYQNIIDKILVESHEQAKNPIKPKPKVAALLSALAKDFTAQAKMYGKIIIQEIVLPNEQKTIKPDPASAGKAGGEKYEHQGIFFKFAFDWQRLYERPETGEPPALEWKPTRRGDGRAMKAASHELKGLMAYMACDSKFQLRYPLMTLIDYHGFRLTASSKLPIVKSASLVYGSDTYGRTIYASDPEFNRLMESVGRQLNIAPHPMKREEQELPPVYISAPYDIEGHLGLDNRKYVVDFGRVFPPTEVTSGSDSSELYKLFRPEFVKQYKSPLSPDIYCGYADETGAFAKTVVEATNYLIYEKIPAFAGSLEESFDKDKERLHDTLPDILHIEGINMRYLGVLRNCVKTQRVKDFLLVEMLARVIKNLLRFLMRVELHRAKTNTSKLTPLDSYIAKFMNNFVLGYEDPKIQAELYQDLELAYGHYGVTLPFPITLSRTLFVSWVARIQVLASIDFSESIRDELCHEPCLNVVKFHYSDIVKIRARVRQMDIIERFEALAVKKKSKNESMPAQQQRRMLVYAKERYASAVSARPDDTRTLLEQARVFRELAIRGANSDIKTRVQYGRDCMRVLSEAYKLAESNERPKYARYKGDYACRLAKALDTPAFFGDAREGYTKDASLVEATRKCGFSLFREAEMKQSAMLYEGAYKMLSALPQDRNICFLLAETVYGWSQLARGVDLKKRWQDAALAFAKTHPDFPDKFDIKDVNMFLITHFERNGKRSKLTIAASGNDQQHICMGQLRKTRIKIYSKIAKLYKEETIFSLKAANVIVDHLRTKPKLNSAKKPKGTKKAAKHYKRALQMDGSRLFQPLETNQDELYSSGKVPVSVKCMYASISNMFWLAQYCGSLALAIGNASIKLKHMYLAPTGDALTDKVLVALVTGGKRRSPDCRPGDQDKEPLLAGLSLCLCNSIPGACLTELSKDGYFRSLTQLELSHLSQLSATHVQELLQHTPNLSKLVLPDLISNINYQGVLQTIATIPKIRALHFGLSFSHKDDWKGVARNCTNLTKLDFYYSNGMDGSVIDRFLKWASNLSSLTLPCQLASVIDDNLKKINQFNTNLRLSETPKSLWQPVVDGSLTWRKDSDRTLNDNTIEWWARKRTKRLHQFKEFHMAGYPITNMALLFSSFSENLQVLDLEYSKNLTDLAVITLANHASGLLKLNLAYCYNVTDASLCCIARRCILLQFLNITLTKIGETAMRLFAKRCVYLEEFILGLPHGVTDASLKSYIQHSWPALKKLSMFRAAEEEFAMSIAAARERKLNCDSFAPSFITEDFYNADQTQVDDFLHELANDTTVNPSIWMKIDVLFGEEKKCPDDPTTYLKPSASNRQYFLHKGSKRMIRYMRENDDKVCLSERVNEGDRGGDVCYNSIYVFDRSCRTERFRRYGAPAVL